MKDQKKNYQEPVLNVIKMRSLPCLDSGSVPAGGNYGGARQNDMLDN
jgi:hypothetical protein